MISNPPYSIDGFMRNFTKNGIVLVKPGESEMHIISKQNFDEFLNILKEFVKRVSLLASFPSQTCNCAFSTFFSLKNEIILYCIFSMLIILKK